MVKFLKQISDSWKKSACILLMFRTSEPKLNSRRYLTYSALSKVLKMKYSQIYHICKTAHLTKISKKVSSDI